MIFRILVDQKANSAAGWNVVCFSERSTWLEVSQRELSSVLLKQTVEYVYHPALELVRRFLDETGYSKTVILCTLPTRWKRSPADMT